VRLWRRSWRSHGKGSRRSPCAVAVEQVVEASQRGKGLKTPACGAAPDAEQAKELSEGYEAMSRSCDGVADELSRFEVRTAAATPAVKGLSDIDDPELKRSLGEAQAAVGKRDQVTSAFLADWRTLSKPRSPTRSA
jgi:hypothetical protein